jgi:hypothetical protein
VVHSTHLQKKFKGVKEPETTIVDALFPGRYIGVDLFPRPCRQPSAGRCAVTRRRRAEPGRRWEEGQPDRRVAGDSFRLARARVTDRYARREGDVPGSGLWEKLMSLAISWVPPHLLIVAAVAALDLLRQCLSA